MDILDSPVELVPCQTTVCHKCLIMWLDITADVKCPCCYSDHLKDTSTITSPTPLLLQLLGAVNVNCAVCKCDVPASLYNEHVASASCVPHPTTQKEVTYPSVREILSKETDTPLSNIEEDLLTNLTKRSLAHQDGSKLVVKTAGQVNPNILLHDTLVHSHTTATYLHGNPKALSGYRGSQSEDTPQTYTVPPEYP